MSDNLQVEMTEDQMNALASVTMSMNLYSFKTVTIGNHELVVISMELRDDEDRPHYIQPFTNRETAIVFAKELLELLSEEN